MRRLLALLIVAALLAGAGLGCHSQGKKGEHSDKDKPLSKKEEKGY